MSIWTPDSWRQKPILQQPTWPEAELKNTFGRLKTLPPLVFAGEIETLKASLAKAADGQAFVLQGGDCAEDFSRCNAPAIRETLKVILQMAVVLTYAGNKQVVKIGRMAGQYAKPRSSDNETIGGCTLPSYRGDSVNLPEFTPEARRADPERLLQSYFYSTATLNLLRAYVSGGFADLHRVHVWNKEFVANSSQGRRYEDIANRIDDALNFMNACGVGPGQLPQLREAEFYTSHEALVLDYEEALTRKDSLSGRWYDCSAHFIWIGERTRQLDGAHLEFFRGVNNPIGVKISSKLEPDELVKMCHILNPNNEKGRLTLTCRFGKDKVAANLPRLVERIKSEGLNVLWSCDPMHGNTFTATSGYKTRDFDHIASEIRDFFAVHKAAGTVPGGVHFELTGDNVTEIKGGGQNIQDDDLAARYLTNCDPRLNCQQALEMSFQVAEMLRQ
jgi:3-deoxy-7-phosphoheptulonate synthase